MALTAGTPLDVLVDRLAAAGWGDLGAPELRGCAVVLEALSRVLPARSGAGKVTAPQLADRCRYTERWVRRCLTLLEELEVIVWERGGIAAGKPVPSWVRVSKAVLVDLVVLAREKQADALLERAQETRRRVVKLRVGYTHRPGRRRKRGRPTTAGSHAELSTALLSTEEVPRAHGPGPGAPDKPTSLNDDAPASTTTRASALARIRADLATRRGRGGGEKRSNGEPGAHHLAPSA